MRIAKNKKIEYLAQAIILILILKRNEPMAATIDKYDEESFVGRIEQNINLGTYGIKDPVSTSGNPSEWIGSKVYYGDDILWRVLDDGLLFADECIFYSMYYNYAFINVTWETSTIRCYLNGYTYIGGKDDPGVIKDYSKDNFIDEYFSEIEAGIITETNLTTENASNGFPGGNDTTDKVFLLSIKEVSNAEYGFVNDETRATNAKDAMWWWLRSPATKSMAYAANCDQNGIINTVGQKVNFTYNTGKGVRPAFNFDTSSVMFSSIVNVNKELYTSFGSSESKVDNEHISDNVWKLTLNGTKESLEASTGDSTILYNDEESIINISHKRGTILDNVTQISAMLIDSNNNVLYYGQANDDVQAINSLVTIPQGLEPGKYVLKVFAESINRDNYTDYASEFSNIIITVQEKELPGDDEKNEDDEIEADDKEDNEDGG